MSDLYSLRPRWNCPTLRISSEQFHRRVPTESKATRSLRLASHLGWRATRDITSDKYDTFFSASKKPGLTILTLTTVVRPWYSRRDFCMGNMDGLGFWAGTFVPKVKYSCAGQRTKLAPRLVKASIIWNEQRNNIIPTLFMTHGIILLKFMVFIHLRTKVAWSNAWWN